MISVSLSFVWVALGCAIITEVLKWVFKKWVSKVSPYLPYIILAVLFVVYSIISKSALTGIINALVITAFSTYAYDVVKAPIKSIIAKIKAKKEK